MISSAANDDKNTSEVMYGQIGMDPKTPKYKLTSLAPIEIKSIWNFFLDLQILS